MVVRPFVAMLAKGKKIVMTYRWHHLWKSYMRDERVNRILVDEGSLVNILLIHTVKELRIPMNELSESHVMIQRFNQGGQRAVGMITFRITIEDMQSSALLHMIDAKTSYCILLGRPWIHENKVVPSTYHQCLNYYKGEVEKKIVADDEPFTDVESHFADTKFYLKNRIVTELKPDNLMNKKNDEATTKRAEMVSDKTKVVAEEVHPNSNKSHKGNIASHGKKVTPTLRYVPKKMKDKGESAKFQSNMLREKLPSEAATRKPREGLVYKQPSPVRISVRRASNNDITVDDESTASNRPSVFDRLGKPTMRIFVFERLGPLKKWNKFQRNYRNTRTPASPKIQKISKDFQSLVPSRIRRQTKLVVLYDEVLKVKPYTVIYTKKHDEDEESMGSSYHVNVEVKQYVSSPTKNLGTDEEPRTTYLSALLAIDEESTYIELLKEFKDVFSWSYKEMPGLDSKVVVHHLAVKNGARPVKQDQRRFRPYLVPLIKTDVN
ncbi:uncharacterized protein [Nicotiana tomentosiformis]|uniref:uncharacterized protein n=1 Tax=Nicotiana tomentosiformis TaxID=4098 RepID=UPI00388C4107